MLLKKAPPKGKRLLVICTTSRREVGEKNIFRPTLGFFLSRNILNEPCDMTILTNVPVFQVLDQMEMLSAFTDVLHVANLSTGSHLISILKQVVSC